ncbi:hypothetical protein BC629DRAFT_375615 [Irpex lacteus]|nr:hypothetical protein BC629DRAFT_375615 [Irpex lacteus]
MVPIADAFNHTQENHVHLESEYDVCTSCGSLEQCPHDQDDAEEIIASSRSAHTTTTTPAIPVESHNRAQLLGSRSRLPVTSEAEVAREASLSKTAVGIYAPMAASTAATANSTGNRESDSVDTCDMVANLVIPPGEEVFNTYGEHLTNAQLLARYGFALDGNENDVVTFDCDDLPPVDFDAQNGGVVDAARQVLALWPRYDRWKESSLVYHADTSAATEDAPPPSVRLFSNTTHLHNPSSSTPIRMCVNSDAKITHELWVCCALLSLAHQRVVFPTAEAEHNEHHDGEADVAALVQLADRQLYWEAQSEFGIEDGPDEDDDEGDELRERASSTKGTSTQHRLDKVRVHDESSRSLNSFCAILCNSCPARSFSRAWSYLARLSLAFL